MYLQEDQKNLEPIDEILEKLQNLDKIDGDSLKKLKSLISRVKNYAFLAKSRVTNEGKKEWLFKIYKMMNSYFEKKKDEKNP